MRASGGRASARLLNQSPWRVALIASSSWSHAFLTPKNHLLYPDVVADRALYEKLPVGEYETWRRTITTNLDSQFLLAKAFLPDMVERGWGRIVNVASSSVLTSTPGLAAYMASKGGVLGLTSALANDVGRHGITVNAVSPGFIGPGRMWDRQVAAQADTGSQYYATDPAVVAEQMRSLIPLRRCGTTDEVAGVVAFLLSDAASYLTGINVEISGGSV